MTIKIITGSIRAFDSSGELLSLKKKGFFYQWYYTRHGWGKKETKFGKKLEASSFLNVVQTTGSGKTLYAVILMWLAHKKIKTAANMNISFLDKYITNFEEFLNLEKTLCLLDDIKHIITSWNCEAADLASEFSNSSRKKGDELLITAQRLPGYVPPAIRDIADEIYVPYIRCFDATTKAPDWRPTSKKYLPLEINGLKFSGDLEFIGYDTYDLTGKTGQMILNAFKTMEISKGFNNDETEIKRPQFLKNKFNR